MPTDALTLPLPACRARDIGGGAVRDRAMMRWNDRVAAITSEAQPDAAPRQHGPDGAVARL